MILTDSNGREATAVSITNHIPRERKGEFDIDVRVAYTQEEAYYRVAKGEVDVRGALVVVDNLTNDVRGTRQRAPATPDETLFRLDRLRQKLHEAGAKAVVVVEVKPMQMIDVRPHNRKLNTYLNSVEGGYGISTQIRMNYLKNDGFHIRKEFDSVVDRTYACAILGTPVPCPTPVADFEPDSVRMQRYADWPQIRGTYAQSVRPIEGHNVNHGWRWE